MGSGLVKLNVWNIALDHLKEEPLQDTVETGAACLWLQRNYNQQRDYMLSRANWRFAVARAALAKDLTAPAFGWDNRYALPADFIRVIPPRSAGEKIGGPLGYEMEGDWLLTNQSDPLLLRYIFRQDNEAKFTNNFVEVLCLRLALRMAHWMTGKASFVDRLREWYVDEIAEAKVLDCLQEHGEEYYDDDIINARYE